MTAPRNLTQVRLERADGPAKGIKQDVCWIDSEFAKVGKVLRKLDSEYAPWIDDTWVVAEVYGTRLFTDIEKQHAAWRRWAEVLS